MQRYAGFRVARRARRFRGAAFGSLALSAAFAAAGQLPPVSTQAVNREPELGPVRTIRDGRALLSSTTDLVISNWGFTSGGRVVYTLQNRGRLATASPFVVDIYIDLARKDTVKHPGLPPWSEQRVTSNVANASGCNAATLRVSADTQLLVAEDDETNNTSQRVDTPPCPDLVVEISKNSVNNNLEYEPRVTVKNVGDRSTEREFVVFLKSGGAATSIPDRTEKRIGPLAPGESQSFNGRKRYGTTRISYDAMADFYETILEKNENNNADSETLGGL